MDWRQDFGGNLNFGDIYYDLAKLKHGLIIQHEHIVNEKYKVTHNENEIKYDFYRNYIHVECEKIFDDWLIFKGFDKNKVDTLTALVYINIAPLHHYPYDHMLYGIGNYMLQKNSLD